ncbi:methyltransferase domain-containing protein [Roseivirga misakiensis]|uniref:Methyltransferase type 11 domain-containing protein n=1 Tax=Roseivirga misakiensis TaxID=1563681 RepID=A0A1E5SZF0_9BACT|nr:methyltransferase domain-containing protein [Roseivirga misakiensis]OEK04504.1 hypothetical protein BFP71_13625 [Roseivirga misakiensis]
MTQNTASTFLICPFTGRSLRYLTEAELVVVNKKINNNELFFYPGVQVQQPLKSALVTEHQTYIYPVQDNILYLKKETAIVTKNRTENYLKRVSEALIVSFEKEYGFNSEKEVEELQTSNCLPSLDSETIAQFKKQITKSGSVFLSVASNNVDDVHNMVFNTNYDEYYHADFDLERLKAVKEDLKQGTKVVLCEPVALPFAEDAVDFMISFDLINEYEKDTQNQSAAEIKRVVSPKGSSVVLFNESLPLHAERMLKKEEMIAKAKILVKPWKKASSAQIHFHPVSSPANSDVSNTIVGKTSLKRQLF